MAFESLREAIALAPLVAACGASPPAPAAPVSVPAVLTDVADVPYLSSLVSAPSGDHLAWVVTHRGRRNLWMADAPAWRPRAVTAFDRDDGQLLTALTFSDDGSCLAFVRGGGENRGETHPNAASDPRGARQEVWTVASDGGAAVRIGEGRAPALTPDGATVAFVQEDADDVVDVVAAPADGGGEARPLIALQGNEDHLAWSPDGRRLAFASGRGTHAFVGVLDTAGDEITWLAPGGYSDELPAWSSDGRVVFLRWEADRKTRHRVQRGVWFDEEPIQAIVADADTGEGHPVEAAPDRTGGFTQWGQDRPLLWAGDRVAFASERDGWIRIYAAPSAGGESVALSPTACESEIGGASPDGATIFFIANCGDPERRHLWKVAAAGGEPVQLTRGTSLQWSPAIVEGGARLAVIDAGATTPPWPALVDATTGELRRLDGAPALDAPLVEPELVTIPLPGTDVTLTGQLFRPAGASAASPAQAILYIHGGPVRQMLSGWHPMEFYHQSYILTQRLVASGRVVLHLNYRLGVGYGRAFRLPAGAGPYGAAELADVLAARDYLAARDDVRDDQVALWGASYGGFVTGMALGTASEKFAGGVSVCGVSSWSNRVSGAHPDDAALTAKHAPLSHVDTWTAPVLLIHGDDDRNVVFQDSLELAHALRDRGKAEVELIAVPGEDHFFFRASSWDLIARRSIEFYDRLLGGAPTMLDVK